MHRKQVEPFQYTDNLTPYDVMRLQNTKTFTFRKGEMYPSIRPPISNSGPAETAEWLSDAMEVSGFERPLWIQKRPDYPYAEKPTQDQKRPMKIGSIMGVKTGGDLGKNSF